LNQLINQISSGIVGREAFCCKHVTLHHEFWASAHLPLTSALHPFTLLQPPTSSSSKHPHNSMRVTIPGKGVLEGVELLDPKSNRPKCYRFSGVPYALPPTGNRRWRKSEPLPSTFSYGSESHPGKYTKPSSPCPQPSRFGIQSTDEDCLQLSIWIPLGNAPPAGWPVFFYIRRDCFELIDHC
jgi:hypothetical protein